VQSVQAAWLEQSSRLRSPLSVSRIKQRLNPLHGVLLRLEARHYAARNYQQLISTTPEVRNDLGRIYGVPADDVEIISNGFSPDEFSPQLRAARREEVRAEMGLKSDEIALLFVGNELERKGLPTILSALSQLREKRFRLLVVGKPALEAVRQMAENFGVNEQVIACGPTSDVARFHAAADAFVLPTQYEAFCLAILEALGSGLPVVTSRVPGAQDAIVEGVNGYLIGDPRSGDELAQKLALLLDDSKREALAAGAAPSVEKYQWPQVLGRYEAVLERNRR
jgi:UDP-glucose:(heptosyl)LPS alpha-1,3-glucosyltransferase